MVKTGAKLGTTTVLLAAEGLLVILVLAAAYGGLRAHHEQSELYRGIVSDSLALVALTDRYLLQGGSMPEAEWRPVYLSLASSLGALEVRPGEEKEHFDSLRANHREAGIFFGRMTAPEDPRAHPMSDELRADLGRRLGAKLRDMAAASSRLLDAGQERILASQARGGILIILLVSSVILGAAAISSLLSRPAADSTGQPRAGTPSVAAEDPDRSVPVRGHDGSREPSGSSNETAGRLRAEEALRLALDYNRSLIEASLDPLVTIDADGKITDANEAAEKVTGRPRAELVGTDFSDCFTDPVRAGDGYKKAFREGSVRDYPLEVRHRDGTVTPVLYNASLYRGLGGEVAGVFAAARDITERKRAEVALKLYTDRLERSNRELQDFAFVASHDLQEPLRKIQAFSDRLSSKYAERLDETARDYLARMQSAAGRMQDLIEGLLTYSRVATQAEPFSQVDLSQLAREVLADLEARVEETGAEVDIADLPTVEADPHQMRQLFQNLIGNALKFHGRRKPRVTVSAKAMQGRGEGRTPDPQRYELSFQDNGIGFDGKHLDRIFVPFQRLHGREDYAGTGMGLAICRRIVERHAGTITARGVPGHGAIFIVELPATQPKGGPI